MATTAKTLATMQAEVVRNCGNLPTSNVIYTGSNNFADFINEALDKVVMLAAGDPITRRRHDNFENFPELRDRRWSDITVNAQGYLLQPDNCLVPDSLTYTKLTSAYAPGSDTEYPITRKDVDTFKLLSNASASAGWPQIWCWEASRLNIWPTPTTTYLTRVILRGVRTEDTLTGSTDTPTMNARWHPAVVKYATHLAMDALGWDADAVQWRARAIQDVTEIVSLLGSSNRKRKLTLKIAGMTG